MLLIVCTGITGAVYAKYITRAEKKIDLTVDAYGHTDVALCVSNNKANAWQDMSLNIVPGKTVGYNPYICVNANNETGYIFIKVVENISGGLTFSNYVSYGVRGDTWTLLSQSGGEKIYWKYVTSGNTDRYFGIINGDQVTFPDTITEEKMTALNSTSPTLAISAYSCHSVNLSGNAGTPEQAALAWAAIKTEYNIP